MKKNVLLFLSLFFVSTILVFTVSTHFLGLMGCTLGTLIGYYLRRVKNKGINKSVFYVLFGLIAAAALLSYAIYAFVGSNRLYYIIIVNLILMALTVYYMIKNAKDITQ